MTIINTMSTFIDFLKERHLLDSYKHITHNIYHRYIYEHLKEFDKKAWIASITAGITCLDWDFTWRQVHLDWLAVLAAEEESSHTGCNSIW